ncbi:MAG: carboxypeptidase-like regulatory domain-containing protein [Flavobacteriaceae bacterium]
MLQIRLHSLLCLIFFLVCIDGSSQQYHAGYTSIIIIDSSRIYKPNSIYTDELHYRALELDMWYPAEHSQDQPSSFGDLFKLFEERAVRYDDTEDFRGVVDELALFYVSELGLGNDAEQLLSIKTNSYKDAIPISDRFPLIIYMAGFNGMGFENYKLLENLAQNGFIVVSIWSVGRYPGNMTNEREDMMEQVYDAEFALNYLSRDNRFDIDSKNTGVLGCSWGGMSAAVLVNRNLRIKSMVSLDGTETHYFGESDTNAYFNGSGGSDNDRYIRDIYNSELVNVEKQRIKYLYFESGDKLTEFTPTEEYHYYKKLKSEKYYLRFTRSKHEDFTCIPSILKASENSVETYASLSALSLNFFQYSLGNKGGFLSNWQTVNALDHTTDHPLEWVKKDKLVFMSVKGEVLDTKSKKPLQYVNVGIINKEIGTVSDGQGKFSLDIPNELINDTLRLSMIGYKPFEIVVRKIENSGRSITASLEEEVSELDEVVLTTRAFKRKNLGNKTKSKFLGTGFGFDQLGAEMGVKINVKQQTFVDAFNFHISYNRLSAQSIFRLNFYNVKKGKPFENILRQQILVPIEPQQTGAITIDLRPYNIVLEEEVIVGLEWVDNKGENKKGEAIFFSMGFLNTGTLYKKSSQARFVKHSSLGVGFNLDVRI